MRLLVLVRTICIEDSDVGEYIVVDYKSTTKDTEATLDADL